MCKSHKQLDQDFPMKVPQKILDEIFAIPQADWREELKVSMLSKEAKGNAARLVEKHPRHGHAIAVVSSFYADLGNEKALMLLEASEMEEMEKVQFMRHIFGIHQN
jgi:hypothetical protein